MRTHPERAQAYANDLGLGGRVNFLGEVTDIPRFLSGLDVFVLSSLTEGLPVALLEAMAAGLPIVSTRAGGVEEAAIDGCNAFLVEPADSDGLAQAMLRMARDARLAEFGNAGRELVRNRFRIETTWQNYYQLYLECGAERAIPRPSLAHRNCPTPITREVDGLHPTPCGPRSASPGLTRKVKYPDHHVHDQYQAYGQHARFRQNLLQAQARRNQPAGKSHLVNRFNHAAQQK